MTTGEKIRNARKAKGMTQEELGAKIGVQKAAINKYETGIVVNLKRSTIAALSRALGVSPTYLLGDIDHEPSDLDLQLLEAYHSADSGIRHSVLILLGIESKEKEKSEQSVI